MRKAQKEAKSVNTLALAIVVETLLGSGAGEKVMRVLLSNNIISRRIENLLSDLKNQICEHSEFILNLLPEKLTMFVVFNK